MNKVKASGTIMQHDLTEKKATRQSREGRRSDEKTSMNRLIQEIN